MPFVAVFSSDAAGDYLIEAEWKSSGHGSSGIADVAEYFNLSIPDFIASIHLESISLGYTTVCKNTKGESTANNVKFTIVSNYAAFSVFSKQLVDPGAPKGTARTCGISMDFNDCVLKFSDLPVIGNLVQGDDCFKLKAFEFDYTPAYAGKKSVTAFNLEFQLIIDGIVMDIGGDSPGPAKAHPRLCADPASVCSVLTGVTASAGVSAAMTPFDTAASPAVSDGKNVAKAIPEVKWFSVNKSFSVLHFDKIGVSFDGNALTVFLSAGFTILALQIDFYGLYLTIPLGEDAKFGFGLYGLAVSFNRDPIAISGGLYHIVDRTHQDLYNGEVILKFSKYGFTALASYCENNGEPSFFLYLMISAPLGGPAFFFVTGLALGMGINRGLKLPDIKSVEKFPFVAAAMGNGGSKLKPTSDIGEVLIELSDWIYPSNGEFFMTAGVRFISFGVVESFALLTVEFGNRLRFSLLGLAQVSLPPKVGADVHDPIAFAQLALMVVLDIDAGYFQIIASLTDESYLLDKDCKLSGGFALCSWFSGSRVGDFFVSLGGCHHPLFKNTDGSIAPLYPELDMVGINWKINSNLKLSGCGYFAVTPACMMAGASLSLTFELGKLKAWLNAAADFLLKWKPFFYSARVAVSVGVSYTLKVWFIHKTFKVELGASLSLWGPDFSGSVHISWYIISFKISFGSDASEPDPINWDNFSSSFLPSTENANLCAVRDDSGKVVTTITVADGLLKIDKRSGVPWVDGDSLKITTSSVMPGTTIAFSGKDSDSLHPTLVGSYSGTLGVVPMAMREYTSTITVSVAKDGSPVDSSLFDLSVENGFFSPALWKDGEPGLNERQSIVAPSGISLAPKPVTIDNILPSPTTSYDMNKLLASETIGKNFTWQPETLPASVDYSKYTDDKIMLCVSATVQRNDVRASVINALGEVFSLVPVADVSMTNIGAAPQDYFMAYPLLKTTGGQYAGKVVTI